MNQDTAQVQDQLKGIGSQLQQEIFRSYMGRADKVVVVLDTGFAVKAVNDFGCQMLGLSRNKIVGAAWLRLFVSRDYREEVRDDFERLLRTGSQEPARNEHNLQADDRQTPLLSWQHFLVKDEDGKAQALLCVGEDVSEQKAIQEMLRRRNGILEALSMASDLFLTATPDVWEDNVLQVLRSLGEARGSERVYGCKNRMTADGQATFLKYEWKASGETRVFKGEETNYKVYDKVGLSRWAKMLANNDLICEAVEDLSSEETQWNVSEKANSLVVVPVFVADAWWGYLAFEDWQEGRECPPSELEALKAVALTFGQAIRRKRIEEELQQQKENVEAKVQERTQELEEAKQDLQKAVLMQQEGRARLTASIHSMSLGFVVTGLEKEILLFNHAVNDILGASEHGWTWQTLEERLLSIMDINSLYEQCLREVKEIVVDELAYKDKYLRLYLTPVKLIEGDGRVIGLVLLIDDISEEKKLQKSRDEFFAVASHELRTPLSAIRGNASIMQDYFQEQIGDGEMVDIVQDIYDSSVRLIEMVNEYLEVSRIEVNKLDTKEESFDLVEVIGGVVRQLESTAREKGLELVFEIEVGTQLRVKADVARTQQVMINLLGNAIKYTDEGGVYVKVEEGEVVKVRIFDTGRGIESKEQEVLFEKFRQVGDRVYTRDSSQGTGMGLYITRLIVEAMGGKVYLADSEVGKGSEFVVELKKG